MSITIGITAGVPVTMTIKMCRRDRVYGGGSIKKNGIYEQVTAALKDFHTYEFGGIEANPRYETCMKAVELVKGENIDFLLAVGGGSVIDATKFIASATFFEGDPWDILSKGCLLYTSRCV